MLSGSEAGEVICVIIFVVGRIREKSSPGAVPTPFLLLMVSVGWLPVRWGPSQAAQKAMCQFYYTYCCLTQWGKASLLFPLALILLPTKFVSGIKRLSLCSLSLPSSASISVSPYLKLSLFFLFFLRLAVLYLFLSLCLSLYLHVSFALTGRTHGDRYCGLNPAERHAEPGPSYHTLPEDLPCLFYIVL